MSEAVTLVVEMKEALAALQYPNLATLSFDTWTNAQGRGILAFLAKFSNGKHFLLRAIDASPYEKKGVWLAGKQLG